MFTRILNALLDGGKGGVDVGMSIIPGVLIISTFVMILTFTTGDNGVYDGAAYEGVGFLPWVFSKVNFLFEWLFGFEHPALMAFPITALGAVGAALGLIPGFIQEGWVDGNAIAVFTAIGMCWSGYLSTHTAMLDALGYRKLTSKAILAHTIGGLVAAFAAHWIFVLYTFAFGTPVGFEGGGNRYVIEDKAPIVIEFVSENQVRVGDRVFTDEAGDTPEEEGSLARVIEGVLLSNHDKVKVEDGVKQDAADFISVDKFSTETRESLVNEVEAGFAMYRNAIAKKMYGRGVDELSAEEITALDEAIPFQFVRAEVKAEADAPEAEVITE